MKKLADPPSKYKTCIMRFQQHLKTYRVKFFVVNPTEESNNLQGNQTIGNLNEIESGLKKIESKYRNKSTK